MMVPLEGREEKTTMLLLDLPGLMALVALAEATGHSDSGDVTLPRGRVERLEITAREGRVIHMTATVTTSEGGYGGRSVEVGSRGPVQVAADALAEATAEAEGGTSMPPMRREGAMRITADDARRIIDKEMVAREAWYDAKMASDPSFRAQQARAEDRERERERERERLEVAILKRYEEEAAKSAWRARAYALVAGRAW